MQSGWFVARYGFSHGHSDTYVLFVEMFKKIETICEKEGKVNNLFAGLGSLRIVKNCDSDLKMLPFHFKDFSHSFSLYGPSIQQITYMFCVVI